MPHQKTSTRISPPAQFPPLTIGLETVRFVASAPLNRRMHGCFLDGNQRQRICLLVSAGLPCWPWSAIPAAANHLWFVQGWFRLFTRGVLSRKISQPVPGVSSCSVPPVLPLITLLKFCLLLWRRNWVLNSRLSSLHIAEKSSL